jgi:DNA-binding response OmpR family regulator
MTTHRALVIDTEVDLADLLGYHLKKEGFKVAKAFSIKRGIRSAEEKKPELIIINNLETPTEKIQLVKKLRANPDLALACIILLVTDKKVQKKLEKKNRWVDGAILTPTKPKALVKEIQEILIKKQKQLLDLSQNQETGILSEEDLAT